jgi:hypothetical protein
VKKSSRWGSTRFLFTEAYTPSLSITFYSAKDATITLGVSNDNGELYSVTVEAKKGFNSVSYPLEIQESKHARLSKKDRALFSAAANGSYYLPKGAYSLTLSSSDGKSTQTLKIE